MSGVFRNIDPPTHSPPGECVPQNQNKMLMVKSLTLKRPKQFLTVTLLTQYIVKKKVTVTSLPLITV